MNSTTYLFLSHLWKAKEKDAVDLERKRITQLLKKERSRPNYFYDANPEVFQQASNSLERLFNEYNDVADIIEKTTDCLNCIVKIIIDMGLLKSGDDNDWEKIVVDFLSLIENFIQREDADRETLGRLCLKPLIETLTNSSLPIDIRKTSADVINGFLTGCKENKKLLSQEKFFNTSDLTSSMITSFNFVILRYCLGFALECKMIVKSL
ncbi:hypothetical protein C1645_567208 [Glomus cerebriforme]|uniref:Uncharacterized protein n=1 Tax=Glomus cerebriforme TaxID=658196 RepID=A0A397T806_9GLOM|nr:hypothetical protein C1645_567208 [Glomus cerebriforme]